MGRLLRVAALLAAVWSCALGAISNVRITGTTNTQAILQYEAPNANACSVQVSEKSDLSVPVNDVDATKFSGANLDSRGGNLSSGTARTFVIGKRAADRGLDWKRYSRALQALTQHYFKITCGSTGDTYSGQFQTANLMMGGSYSEPEPADTSRPGEYAWPTLSLNDRTNAMVDPQTGVLLRQLSLPGDRTITAPNTNQAFQFARSTTWSNPSGALGTGAPASIQGNNTGTLLLTPQNNGYAGYISFFKGSLNSNGYTLNWFQAVLTASISNAGCNSAATDDCKMVACLTIDGVTCYAGGQPFEQALTTTATPYSFGTTGTAIDLWQAAGERPPNGAELATKQGNVNCDGSTKVTLAGGDFFGTYWTAGSTITINAVDYSIAAVTSQSTLNVTTPCTAGTGLAYTATNFGVLIRKKTASPDTVSVQASHSNYQMGVFPKWDFTGAFDLCGPTPVIGPTGNPGYNCTFTQSPPIYWVDSVTGEAHMFSRYFGGPPGATTCGTSDSVIFDSVNPDIWYCSGSTTFGAPQQPLRAHYYGNHSEPLNTQYPGHFEEGEQLQLCNGNVPPTNQPCMQYTNLVGSTDLGTLTAAFDPSFQKDRYLYFYFVGTENGILVFRDWRGGYTSIGWTVLFDPNATSNKEPNNAGCVGGGLPGCVIAAIPSWSRPGARWCPLKGNNPMYQPGWQSLSAYIWGAPGDTRPGVGPYQSAVNDGTALSATVGAAGGPTTCPPNSLNITGQQCTTVQVDGEPRDLSPCVADLVTCGGALETGAPGELMNAQVNDEFTIGPAAGSSEVVRLVAKGGTNNLTWTIQRGINGTLVGSAANPALFAFCAVVPDPTHISYAGGDWYWDYADDPHGYNTNGNTILKDAYSINAHFFFQNGTMAAAYTMDPRCDYGPGHACYQTREFSSVPQFVSTPPVGVVTQNPAFAGKFGPADSNEVQEHPSGPGLSSKANDRHYFYDGRPFNGGPLSGSATADGGAPAVVVTGQLYKFAAAPGAYLDRKFLPTFAFAGSHALVDVSGPGSAIGGGTADAFRYCVAVAAGECRAGSAPNDIFVNAPDVSRPYCHYPGQATGMADETDLCIGNNSVVYNSIMENGISWVDNYGAHERMVTKGLSRNRILVPFWHTHALPSANWILVHTNYAQNVGDMVMLAKVPPPPPQDSVNRAAYIPLSVTVKPPPGLGATNAVVEFGYAEYGAPGQFFCTSRAETCAVGPGAQAGSIDAVNPFYFETTEAAALAGTPCSTGCTIAVPAVSQRVVYGRVVYRNGSNQVVARGGAFTLAAP